MNEKSAKIIADLMFAYINKDEEFPHNFEVKAFEEGLLYLQEHYSDDKYSTKMFEQQLKNLIELTE